MINRIIIFLIGVFLSSYALMFIIVYLNLLKMGYSFLDYLKYIATSPECLVIFLGILLIHLSLRRKKHE